MVCWFLACSRVHEEYVWTDGFCTFPELSLLNEVQYNSESYRTSNSCVRDRDLMDLILGPKYWIISINWKVTRSQRWTFYSYQSHGPNIFFEPYHGPGSFLPSSFLWSQLFFCRFTLVHWNEHVLSSKVQYLCFIERNFGCNKKLCPRTIQLSDQGLRTGVSQEDGGRSRRVVRP